MTTEAAQKPTQPCAASPDTVDDGFIRLHITPFDADLLKIIVPASSLPSARNISYHTIETFPEKRYGYVELPVMDAEKIKKKLNGTVLKGSKVRVEKARPTKRIEPESSDGEAVGVLKEKKSKKNNEEGEQQRPKKRKREMGVIDGIVLEDRKVKRGWTEPTDYKSKKKSSKDSSAKESKSADKEQKRKQPRSKYIDKEECLLKTRMPPNEMGNLPAKEDSSTKKRKKKTSDRQVTVHEFERTTKFMSFLRSTGQETTAKQATEYVDGKGWVDEEGNVVETVKEKERPKPQPKKALKQKEKSPVESESGEDDTSDDSDTSDDETSSEEEDFDDEEPTKQTAKPTAKQPESDKSAEAVKEESSGSDTSDSDSDSSEEDSSDDEGSVKPTSKTTDGGITSKPLTIGIPPPPATPKAVHPLEALYKKAKPSGDASAVTTAAEDKAGFSFFGGDEEDNENSDGEAGSGIPAVPMTPFTKQDFEWRNVRSAAPTPDTIHPQRTRSFFPSPDHDVDMAEVNEEEEEGYDEDGADEGTAAPLASSDFQKWFWENRRDLNKSWMTRRKTAAKEKRHRENKARASKSA